MNGERMALVAGWADTRTAVVQWRRDPWRSVGAWIVASASVGLLLMVATWLIAAHVGATIVSANFSDAPSLHGVAVTFGGNLLVLALHACICVAGFMAASSMPIVAEGYSGFTRALHLAMRPIALVFVGLCCLSSLARQAWTLGHIAASVAPAYHVGAGELLVLLLPHALPELTALFLPLGAWMILARRKRWGDLLAASMVSTAVALPILLSAAFIEQYVTPHVIRAVT